MRKQYLFQVLRTGCAMCFIGHGAFGLITKAVWCNYFALAGIGHDAAYRLMPVIGSIDILLGLSLLIYPVRAVPLWLVIWGFVTAAMRPMAGEPFAELVERAGNYLVPAALLVLCRPPLAFQGWFKPLTSQSADDARLPAVRRILQLAVFMLLAGHAWLNLSGKPGLLSQYKAIGFSDAAIVGRAAGSIELLLAVVTLVYPFRIFLLTVFCWKTGTELFYPHYELFEWIERGGSYAAILVLWFCVGAQGMPGPATGFTRLFRRQSLSGNG